MTATSKENCFCPFRFFSNVYLFSFFTSAQFWSRCAYLARQCIYREVCLPAINVSLALVSVFCWPTFFPPSDSFVSCLLILFVRPFLRDSGSTSAGSWAGRSAASQNDNKKVYLHGMVQQALLSLSRLKEGCIDIWSKRRPYPFKSRTKLHDVEKSSHVVSLR